MPLIFGRLTAADYEDAVARDPRIDALRARDGDCVEEPQFTADYHDPEKRSIANALRVELTDGTVLEETVEYPIGHRRRRADGMPLLVAKFRTNLARRFPQAQQEQILRCIAGPGGAGGDAGAGVRGAVRGASGKLDRLLDDGVGEQADAFDFDLAEVAGLHEDLRVAGEAYAAGCAGDDDVAGAEGHAVAEQRDQGGDVEDHVGCVGVLKNPAIEAGLEAESFGACGKLVGGDKDGAEGAGGVEVLANGPLLGFELVVADRGVVEDGVASDVVERAVHGDGASGGADDGDELAFVVELGGDVGPDDGALVADEGGGEAAEEGGIVGGFEATFCGVVNVVEADTDDLFGGEERWQVLDGGGVKWLAGEECGVGIAQGLGAGV